ncbi:cysteine proteinase, partial [Ceratobasidium sp. AG-I]
DFQRLRPGRWLNDEVVNFYLAIVRQRAENYVFNTFFYEKCDQYESVKGWTNNINIFTKNMIFIPIHIDGNHWICAVIRPQSMVIEIYDSMKVERRNVYQRLCKYLVQEYRERRLGRIKPADWVYHVNPDAPMQSGSVDCGVFVCQYIDYLSRGCTPDFGEENMVELRDKMVNEILDAGL